MSGRFEFDRQVGSWLTGERPTTVPEGLLEAVIVEVDSTPRRPGWLIPDRWTWRHSARLKTAARLAVLAGAVVALVVLLAWIVALAGAPRPAPPFGLTRAGLIAFDTAEGITVERADGTNRSVIVKADGASVSPTWSRDGLHLAYWHRPGSFGPWSLIVTEPDGSNPIVVAEKVSLASRESSLNQPSNIAWSPDSTLVAFAGDIGGAGGESIFVARVGDREATRITDPELKAVDPAWRPDASVIAFQSEKTGTLHVVAPDGAAEHELASLKNTFLWPEWSPDGAWIATAAFVADPKAKDGGQSDVFVISANGSIVKNISRDPASEFSPTWSPDGSRLAWARQPLDGSERGHIVVAEPNGPNVVEIRIDADLAPPIWSPDGTRIFSYVMGTDGNFHEVIVIDPAGIAPVVHLPAEGNRGNSNWQRLP